MRNLSPFNSHFLSNINSLIQDSLEQVLPEDKHQLFSSEDGWVIRLDLPGFEKSELKLHFEDKALHLKAEKAEDSVQPRPSVEHRFALGEEVDSQRIKAKLELGVLEITLPRKEALEPKQLTINID